MVFQNACDIGDCIENSLLPKQDFVGFWPVEMSPEYPYVTAWGFFCALSFLVLSEVDFLISFMTA